MLKTRDYVRRYSIKYAGGTHIIDVPYEDACMKVVTPCEYINTLIDTIYIMAQEDRTSIKFSIKSPVSSLRYSFRLTADTVKIDIHTNYSYVGIEYIFEVKTTYEYVDKFLFDCIEHGYRTGEHRFSRRYTKCGDFDVFLDINDTGIQKIIHSVKLNYGNINISRLPIIKYCEDEESINDFISVLRETISSFKCEDGLVYRNGVKCETDCLSTEVTKAIDPSSVRHVKRA